MTPKEQYEARKAHKMNVKDCCHNCKYHQMNPADMKQVFCRRYPPQMNLIPQRNGSFGGLTQWPAVPISWWCGEYQKQFDFVKSDSLQTE